MFTGIVQDIGIVTDIAKKGDWLLTIKTNHMSLAHTTIGASVSCSGICLTVIAKTNDSFQVQASAETLAKTTMMHWQSGTCINLEPALRMGDELGGHLVTGHVDGVAFVTSKNKEGDSIRLQFEAPAEYTRFLAPKGSAVVDGVSLTINEIDHARFGVNIIPHTQTATTLGKIAIGDAVNFEVDMIARYVEQLLHSK
jgi:riboflavin synthase